MKNLKGNMAEVPSDHGASTTGGGVSGTGGWYCCPEWEPGINRINAPLVLMWARSGGEHQYEGKPFAFCPWCGTRKPPYPNT